MLMIIRWMFDQRKNAFQWFTDQIQCVDRLRSQFHGQRRFLVQIISNTSDDILFVVATNDVREQSPLMGRQRRAIVMHEQVDRSRLNDTNRVRRGRRRRERGVTVGSWSWLFLEVRASVVGIEVAVVVAGLVWVDNRWRWLCDWAGGQRIICGSMPTARHFFSRHGRQLPRVSFVTKQFLSCLHCSFSYSTASKTTTRWSGSKTSEWQHSRVWAVRVVGRRICMRHTRGRWSCCPAQCHHRRSRWRVSWGHGQQWVSFVP